MMSEFKSFALRGNVVDMAVGVVIGGAFGKIVASLVADIITPLIGLLIGGVKFTNFFIALDGKAYATLDAAKAAGVPTLNLGIFFQSVFDFVIIAFAIFMAVRGINRMQRKKAEEAATPGPPPEPTAQEKLLAEIRDLLAQRP
ncbi:MAG: large-conductance mechanosensitive channel protein MscL [Deltaproteobacteria bacterium]|nr:large-conductance mechanosensitive channel protein MscL [Deltaproteobacteria bacterium]MCB9788893.1 large-conductance mechanosensitive channel protein MscL [Deltaproteobacteria bacterium]